MRLAVLADIHGNIRALEAVIAALRHETPDRIVNLGDCFSGPLHAAAVADRLIELDWLTVRGNHDRWLLETPPQDMGPSDRHAFAQLDTKEEDWLRDLPATARLDGDVLLCHGTPASDTTYLTETLRGDSVREATPDEVAARLGGEAAALVLCGHTHIPRLIHRPGGGLVLNPGSVGLPAYTDDDPWHFVETGTPHARYALATRASGGWSVEFRRVVYDWEAAARDAAKAGRPDWAHALRTGLAMK
ncbi:MAG TPA: metallophosphoesterase family protein [Beijerinckiaceae bacterium]|nr:metallophosphoesterase family protein [Beijerinckiaceae bacterium]